MAAIYVPHLEIEKKAIERLKVFEPVTEPYYVCYSGGKDSDCIKILSKLANVKADFVNNHTTVDAPETVYYIRSQKDIKVEYPKKSMWQLIEERCIPPTRLIRYCCSELKERGGKGRVKVTGVRWAESNSRKENSDLVQIIGKPKTSQKIAEDIGANIKLNSKGVIILNDDNDISRRMVERCYRTTSTMINPIIDWEDTDVWNFLAYYGCKSNPLYECGFNRVGCIGCPMASKHRKEEFLRYPKYIKLYKNAFAKMLERRKIKGLNTIWDSPDDVFAWWVDENPDQLKIEGFDNDWWII